MSSVPVHPSDDCRLRNVFGSKVLSLGIAAGTTFGEVAGTLRTVSSGEYGDPLAIEVIFAGSADGWRPASRRR